MSAVAAARLFHSGVFMSSDGCEEGTEASTCRPDGTGGTGDGGGEGGGVPKSLNQQHVFSPSGI